jgi:pterin-4a-carbinolamine dehydratase
MPFENKTPLTLEEVDQTLLQLEGWSRKELLLSKDFVFEHFKAITSFLNHLVKTITDQNHHPDFALDTSRKTISVSVTTHSEKAITRADITFAETLNSWSESQ